MTGAWQLAQFGVLPAAAQLTRTGGGPLPAAWPGCCACCACCACRDATNSAMRALSAASSWCSTLQAGRGQWAAASLAAAVAAAGVCSPATVHVGTKASATVWWQMPGLPLAPVSMQLCAIRIRVHSKCAKMRHSLEGLVPALGPLASLAVQPLQLSTQPGRRNWQAGRVAHGWVYANIGGCELLSREARVVQATRPRNKDCSPSPGKPCTSMDRRLCASPLALRWGGRLRDCDGQGLKVLLVRLDQLVQLKVDLGRAGRAAGVQRGAGWQGAWHAGTTQHCRF